MTLQQLTISDLKAAIDFADKQAEFYENIPENTDPVIENENQESFNMWFGRAEALEDVLFSRYEDIFKPLTAEFK